MPEECWGPGLTSVPEPPLPRPQDRAVINQRQKQKQTEKCNQLGKGRAGLGRGNQLSRWGCWLIEGGSGRASRNRSSSWGHGEARGSSPPPYICMYICVPMPMPLLVHGSAHRPPPTHRLLPRSSCPPLPCQLTTLAHVGFHTHSQHASICMWTQKHMNTPSWVTDICTHMLLPQTPAPSLRCTHVPWGLGESCAHMGLTSHVN